MQFVPLHRLTTRLFGIRHLFTCQFRYSPRHPNTRVIKSKSIQCPSYTRIPETQLLGKSPMPTHTQDELIVQLRQIIASELPRLIEFRHDLHAHPELKFEEKRTAERIQAALSEREIEFAANLARGTGVMAYISGDDTSRTVGLRADMDALPIDEQNDLPYTSTTIGVMHACGHDGHTTILLGTAFVLAKLADAIGGLPRPVKFLFQPAEEGGAGARYMIEDGCLSDQLLGQPVTELYGIHCWPWIDLGCVGTRPGPLLAAADMFEINIKGTMAHAAWPHRSHDPIVTGAAIVSAIQTIASRNIDPLDSIVISTTMFHAGSATNVIPENTTLGGTLRTLSEEIRVFAKTRIAEIATNIADAHQCSATIVWDGDGYPCTHNDVNVTRRLFQYAHAALPDENVLLVEQPVMGGEDFSFYCHEVPSCFFLIGQRPTINDQPYPNVHTPTFNFNDDSIALGVEMFCRIALDIR